MPPARQILLQETTDAPIRRRLEAFCHSQHHEMAELESRHTVFEFTGHSAGITEFVRQVQFQIRDPVAHLRSECAERVEDVMSRGAICAEADDPITVAVDTMIDARLRSLPDVERRAGGPVLVGIVSRTDVLPCLILERGDAP